ncbi:MAG: CcmD family protein [Chitinophagales bacterium]|nr:CcmD family protein [Bacteroidota bacterium]MCB9256522.1 CcmD family protein [Chitinophagales bacterium]
MAISFIFSGLGLLAQESGAYESMLVKSNKMIAVVGVLAIILLGIAVYLFSLDKKLKKLEEKIDSN